MLFRKSIEALIEHEMDMLEDKLLNVYDHYIGSMGTGRKPYKRDEDRRYLPDHRVLADKDVDKVLRWSDKYNFLLAIKVEIEKPGKVDNITTSFLNAKLAAYPRATNGIQFGPLKSNVKHIVSLIKKKLASRDHNEVPLEYVNRPSSSR